MNKPPYGLYVADASLFKLHREPMRLRFNETGSLGCQKYHGVLNYYCGRAQ